MSTPEFPAPAPSPIPAPLASWGDRALGFLIDYLPIIILNAVFFSSRTILTFTGLIGIAYLVFLGHLDGVTGQTPGKAMMGLRLVNGNGELLGSGAGIGRKFLRAFLDGIVCGLGHFLPLVDAKRQTIADKVMSSYVVSGIQKKSFSIDLWMLPKTG